MTESRIRTGMCAAALLLSLATAAAVQERPRETWQRLDDIFAALGAVPGAHIADVGAGDGYFTTRLSALVGEGGAVHAVDVDAGALRRLRARVEADALGNVRIIEGAFDDPRLPEGAIDGALIVNAYHEMTSHQQMLAGLKRALKPGGRLVIVEPISDQNRDAARADQTRRHEIAAHYVLEDLRAAGFRTVRFEEEFARRPHGDVEWIIVASPAPGRPTGADATPAVVKEEQAWESAALRVSVEDAARLFESGKAVFLDVRNREMFEAGRVAGARLMGMGRVEAMAGEVAVPGKRLITYCS